MAKELVGRGWMFPPRIGPTGGLALTDERNELEQSIHIILSTTPGERVMHPDFGCGLEDLVFAPNNSHTWAQVSRLVEEALGMWEPRINVIGVTVRADGEDANRLLIDVAYETLVTHDQRSLVYPFYLIPGE